MIHHVQGWKYPIKFLNMNDCHDELGRFCEGGGLGSGSSTNTQSKWENSNYGDNSPFPIESNPKIIENFEYFEGSEEQLNGEFENPNIPDAEYDNDKVTQANTFFHSNVQIFEPADPDVRSMNGISTNEIKEAIDKLPEGMRDKIDAIVINPFESTEDERAIAAAAQGTISIYGNKSEEDYSHGDDLQHVFTHEAAHLYDGEGSNRISMSAEWKDAIEKDAERGSISSYAGLNRDKPQEDFAESVAKYITDPTGLQNASPSRFNFLSNIFKK